MFFEQHIFLKPAKLPCAKKQVSQTIEILEEVESKRLKPLKGKVHE